MSWLIHRHQLPQAHAPTCRWSSSALRASPWCQGVRGEPGFRCPSTPGSLIQPDKRHPSHENPSQIVPKPKRRGRPHRALRSRCRRFSVPDIFLVDHCFSFRHRGCADFGHARETGSWIRRFRDQQPRLDFRQRHQASMAAACAAMDLSDLQLDWSLELVAGATGVGVITWPQQITSPRSMLSSPSCS